MNKSWYYNYEYMRLIFREMGSESVKKNYAFLATLTKGS